MCVSGSVYKKYANQCLRICIRSPHGVLHVCMTRGGRIIDNLQIDNLQIDNRQIDNQQIDNLTNIQQIDNRQKDNLSFSKINSAIPLPCPHGLGNWQHGVVIFIMGEVGLSNFSTSWVRKLAS